MSAAEEGRRDVGGCSRVLGWCGAGPARSAREEAELGWRGNGHAGRNEEGMEREEEISFPFISRVFQKCFQMDLSSFFKFGQNHSSQK